MNRIILERALIGVKVLGDSLIISEHDIVQLKVSIYVSWIMNQLENFNELEAYLSYILLRKLFVPFVKYCFQAQTVLRHYIVVEDGVLYRLCLVELFLLHLGVAWWSVFLFTRSLSEILLKLFLSSGIG